MLEDLSNPSLTVAFPNFPISNVFWAAKTGLAPQIALGG